VKWVPLKSPQGTAPSVQPAPAPVSAAQPQAVPLASHRQVAPAAPTVSSGGSGAEMLCVVERVGKSAKVDESARVLAAQIADRCSERIVFDHAPCPADVQARCSQIDEDTRASLTGILERFAYQLLINARQTGAN
jgi:hypothetical protein